MNTRDPRCRFGEFGDELLETYPLAEVSSCSRDSSVIIGYWMVKGSWRR
jgi:hypothetical protein